MIPWGLYDLTPRDQGSPIIRPFNRQAGGVDAGPSTITTVRTTVPDEYVALITAVNIYAQQIGGGGNPFRFDFQAGIVNPGSNSNSVYLIKDNKHSTIRSDGSATWTGSPLCMVHGGEDIDLSIRYTAAATSIVWNTCIAGILIPRGTMSLT